MALPNYSIPEDQVPVHNVAVLSDAERNLLKEEITQLLHERGATLVAHYYVDGDVQDLAEATGGCVSDSLEMARFGRDRLAETGGSTIVVAGVRFMGETAKILSPEVQVVMPTLEAECSLDLGCPPDEFQAFVDANPDRTVVVYANTSARVKAMSDWVVTSSVALPIVESLKARGEKVLWAPDKHLGGYIQSQTGADMLLWSGACVVHEEFKAKGLEDMLKVYPDAAVLVHPESPKAMVDVADVVGSTTTIVNAARRLDNKVFIVATDRGIFHKLKSQNPNKRFIEAPTAGEGATCRSCAHCPWMAMNELGQLAACLRSTDAMAAREVHVDPEIGRQAMVPLTRMLEFSA